MAKYEIEIPFGRLEASTYSELRLLIEQEAKFWEQFDFERVSTEFRESSFGEIAHDFRGTLVGFTTFWKQKLEVIEALDGRQFENEFGEFKQDVLGSALIPPWSQSVVARSALSEQLDGRRNNTALLLIGHVVNFSSTHTYVQYQDARGAFFGAVNGLFASTLSIANSDIVASANAVANETTLLAREKVKDIAAEIGAVRRLREQVETELHQRIDAVDKKNNRVVEKYGRGMIDQKNRSIEQEAIRQETFEKLVDAFNAHLRLSKPVQLWEDLEARHKTASSKAWKWFLGGGLSFALVSIISVTVYGEAIAQAFIPSSCVVGGEASCSRISPKGPLIISAILAVSTVWLWFLRLQMKVHLSERHLFLDARERKAFAETYLALVKGGEVTNAHEAVVLQSLFRPTQDGIIKDDGGIDVGIAGLLSRALSKN